MFLLTGDQLWVGGSQKDRPLNPSVPGGGQWAANPGGQRVNLVMEVLLFTLRHEGRKRWLSPSG